MKNLKQFNKKCLIATAVVGLLAVGTLGTMPVLASTNPTAYKIADFLGIEKDLATYGSIVGHTVTQDGISMTLNEVIVDNDQLIVSVTTTSDESLVDRYGGPGGFLHINGQEINKGMYSIQNELIDDYTAHAVLVFPVDEQLEGELTINLKLATPLIDVERSPHWNYEFKATGEALTASTTTFDINHQVTVGESTLNLTRYTSNVVGDRIYFEELTNDTDTDSVLFTIEGTDQDGNHVAFNWHMSRDSKGDFSVVDEYLTTVQNASKLTLTVHANGEPVGEPFVINK